MNKTVSMDIEAKLRELKVREVTLRPVKPSAVVISTALAQGKPIVSTRSVTLNGRKYQPGDEVEPDVVTGGRADALIRQGYFDTAANWERAKTWRALKDTLNRCEIPEQMLLKAQSDGIRAKARIAAIEAELRQAKDVLAEAEQRQRQAEAALAEIIDPIFHTSMDAAGGGNRAAPRAGGRLFSKSAK